MDSLTITIIFITLSTVIGAFVKGRMRDTCLLHFKDNLVNIELKDGKVVWGVLRLEATGMELNYKVPYLDKQDNNIENSFIIYKDEYPNIQSIVRFVDDLDDKAKKRRSRFLIKINQEKGLTTITRRIRNVFATIKDSVMEVVSLLIGRAKQISPAQRVLSSQDKHVSQMQSSIFSTLTTSFEPLLEKHIGKRVVLQLSKADKIIEYSGILRGYTANFLELMDLNYSFSQNQQVRKVDIIVPRFLGLVRHLGK